VWLTAIEQLTLPYILPLTQLGIDALEIAEHDG
jgi:hypothetical protein